MVSFFMKKSCVRQGAVYLAYRREAQPLGLTARTFLDSNVILDGKPLEKIIYFDADVDVDLDCNTKAKKFNFVSCRGLLVEGYLSERLPSQQPNIEYINPTTNCTLDLPNPQKGSNDPCPNGDLSWRALNIPDFDVANRLQKYDCSRVLEEGILFMPALVRVVSSNPIIVCVDLLQQACTTLNVPESLSFKNREITRQKWADPIQISLPSLDGYPRLRKRIPRIYQGDEEDFLVYTDKLPPKYIAGTHVCKIGSEVLSDVPAPPPIRVPATFVSVARILELGPALGSRIQIEANHIMPRTRVPNGGADDFDI
ncbi:hypothetical protein POM88_048254 [Heracleum sosnowskyi]|uniref:Uncharacterized protein n=1 Tax=Heracleum sosnowskyi TaxID=360622 RepID=A0AAD8GUY3_9APIA|nr:hypothetical protein POM88_048254 [Heracleum sosnowskyi]